jgi:hypothetical protein
MIQTIASTIIKDHLRQMIPVTSQSALVSRLAYKDSN